MLGPRISPKGQIGPQWAEQGPKKAPIRSDGPEGPIGPMWGLVGALFGSLGRIFGSFGAYSGPSTAIYRLGMLFY